jgi:hypothetical protein
MIFGLGSIKDAFPDAKVIALPEMASTINKQMFGKIDHWIKIIGHTNVPRKAVNIWKMSLSRYAKFFQVSTIIKTRWKLNKEGDIHFMVRL